MKNRKELKFGRYKIIAGILNGRSRAVALVGNGRKAFEEEADNVDEAIEKLVTKIQTEQKHLSAERREPHIGTVTEYVDALNAIKINANEALMLAAHNSAPNNTMTATELASAIGSDSYETANSQYGRLGRKIGEAMGLPKPSSINKETIYTKYLAGGTQNEGENWRWVMHPEIVQALNKCNMI